MDMVSDDKDKAARVRGRRARKAVKDLHSIERDGITRRRHIMEQ